MPQIGYEDFDSTGALNPFEFDSSYTEKNISCIHALPRGVHELKEEHPCEKRIAIDGLSGVLRTAFG